MMVTLGMIVFKACRLLLIIINVIINTITDDQMFISIS